MSRRTASKILNMTKNKNTNKIDSIISEHSPIINKYMTINQMNKALTKNLIATPKSIIEQKQMSRILNNIKIQSEHYSNVGLFAWTGVFVCAVLYVR